MSLRLSDDRRRAEPSRSGTLLAVTLQDIQVSSASCAEDAPRSCGESVSLVTTHKADLSRHSRRIPDPQSGAEFQTVRDQFNALLTSAGATIDSHCDLSKPVHVKIVGPAFFDGEHRGARGTTNPPHGHGRCNSSSRALWEIHAVYGIFKEGKLMIPASSW